MGGSGEDPNKGTNWSADGLVCVQQRNESAWPEDIHGLEMLPEGSMAAPRSGKLLGTEDAKFSEGNLGSLEEFEKSRGLLDLGMNVAPSPPLKMKSSRFSLDQESISLPKRKNRQCALLKILKLTKMDVGEQLRSPTGSSLPRKDDLDNDEDVSIITESEFLGNLHDLSLVVEKKVSAGLPSIIADAPQQSIQSSRVHASPFSSEENESSLAESKGFPEWRSKAKRNSRPRKTHAPAVWGQDLGSIDTGPRPIVQIRSVPFRQARLTVNPKYDMSGLHDIPIEVRSSRRSHRVPYRSLASQLTGCPIVGHPLAVEVLDSKNRGRGKSRKSNIGLVVGKKKTRRMSSFKGAHRLKKPLPGEMAKSASVACVPLSVVFSRMKADLS